MITVRFQSGLQNPSKPDWMFDDLAKMHRTRELAEQRIAKLREQYPDRIPVVHEIHGCA